MFLSKADSRDRLAVRESDNAHPSHDAHERSLRLFAHSPKTIGTVPKSSNNRSRHQLRPNLEAQRWCSLRTRTRRGFLLSCRGSVQRMCFHFNTDGKIKLLRACVQRGSNIAIISGSLPKCSFWSADSLGLKPPVPHRFARAFGAETECSYCFSQPSLRR
jgi:hypothetical protein